MKTGTVCRGLALASALVLAGCSAGAAGTPSTPAPSANFSTLATPGTPAARGTASTTAEPTVGAGPLYVALGDSLAKGFQVSTGDSPSTSYAALARTQLAATGHDLTLVNLSCSGASTTSISTTDRCAYPEGSQLAQAEKVLGEHRGEVGLVSIDIGANDVMRCVQRDGLDPGCLATSRSAYVVNLPTILQRLRTAAGPDAVVAVLTYYNPYLSGPAAKDPSLRAAATAAVADLNSVISLSAKRVGGVVVDLPGVFKAKETRPVTLLGKEVPLNAAMVCTYTWYCAVGDIHLTDRGQAAVASAVVAAVADDLPD